MSALIVLYCNDWCITVEALSVDVIRMDTMDSIDGWKVCLLSIDLWLV